MPCIEIPLFISVIVFFNNNRDTQNNIKFLTKIDKAIIKNWQSYCKLEPQIFQRDSIVNCCHSLTNN